MVDKINKKFCASCGNDKEDIKETFCNVCISLEKEEFYHIKTNILAKRYAKKFFKRNLNYKERRIIDEMYRGKGKTHVIGTMPSKCPFCFRLSKNQGEFVLLEIGSEDYARYIINKEKLMAVCTPCGSLAHFLKEFYDLTADEINSMLKNIKIIKDKRKK